MKFTSTQLPLPPSLPPSPPSPSARELTLHFHQYIAGSGVFSLFAMCIQFDIYNVSNTWIRNYYGSAQIITKCSTFWCGLLLVPLCVLCSFAIVFECNLCVFIPTPTPIYLLCLPCYFLCRSYRCSALFLMLHGISIDEREMNVKISGKPNMHTYTHPTIYPPEKTAFAFSLLSKINTKSNQIESKSNKIVRFFSFTLYNLSQPIT